MARTAIRRSRQRGAALVMALLLAAVTSVAAAGVASRLQLDLRLTENVLLDGQTGALATGIEAWALGQLARDLQASPEVDYAGEDWARPLPPTTMEGAEVAGRIEDLQGRFNLNALAGGGEVEAEAVARLRRLLVHLELSPDRVPALLDWLDDDQDIRYPDGAEDDLYSRLDPPYRSADRPLADIAELRLVAGFDGAVYARLAPHVSALPAAAAINVNTAGPAVLMSLADGLRAGDIEALVERRRQQPFTSVEAFLRDPAFAGREVSAAGLGVTSEHFACHGSVRLQRATRHLTSYIQRSPADGPRLRYRRYGGPS